MSAAFLDEALTATFGKPRQVAEGIVQYGEGAFPLRISELPEIEIPVGLQTPEGRKRVGEAGKKLSEATTYVANLAKEMMRSVGALPATLTDDDASDLNIAIEAYEDALEEYGHALEGR